MACFSHVQQKPREEKKNKEQMSSAHPAQARRDALWVGTFAARGRVLKVEKTRTAYPSSPLGLIYKNLLPSDSFSHLVVSECWEKRETRKLPSSPITEFFCSIKNSDRSSLPSPGFRATFVLRSMFKVSNNLIGILNLVTFLLSVPILGAGIWLSNRASTDCEKFLEKPIIALGVFLLVVSLAGFIGACCRVTWLLWVYLLVMFLLIVLLFCFTIFAFVVTNKGAGEVVSQRGYKEYRLGDYSNWLQKRVNNNKNWRRIRSCLQDSNVCKSLADDNLPQAEFYNKNLSPIQSGCCKPPTSCGYLYVNATSWTKTPSTSVDPDCTTWDNNPNRLCYDCQSCKAGVLANLKRDWKKVAVVNIIFLIFLVVVYSVGCCAFRNSREDNAYPRWKGYP
ncbi:hypothetical protein H6P81_000568 [Aristolochia fimbriata]|uniref:Tetraspanin-8 n=1 Tax=Aristolochia fimbriata TaxID=158543 RepID=A0AAV7F4G5_ARIFI|nr:hypothetical protein H6P81_000568 [Aristolochia fimbriata]